MRDINVVCTYGTPLRMCTFGVIRMQFLSTSAQHCGYGGPTDVAGCISAAQGLVNMLPLLGMLSDLLPADTLEWKIDILGQGAAYTEAKLSQVGKGGCPHHLPTR